MRRATLFCHPYVHHSRRYQSISIAPCVRSPPSFFSLLPLCFPAYALSRYTNPTQALRAINNNPEYSKYAAGHGRLIVDFAVENRSELIKQAQRRERRAARGKKQAAGRTAQGSTIGRGAGDGAEGAGGSTAKAKPAKLTRAQRRKRAKLFKASAAAGEATKAAAGPSVATQAAAAETVARATKKRKVETRPRSVERGERALERVTRDFGDDLAHSQPERRERVKKTKKRKVKPDADEASFAKLVDKHKASLNLGLGKVKEAGAGRWFD